MQDRRAEFIAEISQFDPDMLIIMWLDETSSDRRTPSEHMAMLLEV